MQKVVPHNTPRFFLKSKIFFLGYGNGKSHNETFISVRQFQTSIIFQYLSGIIL